MDLFKKILVFFHSIKKLYFKELEYLAKKNDEQEKKFYTQENVKIIDSKINDYTYISFNSIIFHADIGKFCSIGPNVVIGFGEHPGFYLSTSPVFYTESKMFDTNFYSKNNFEGKKRVIIGNDVWIGSSVYIKNGVTIGNGAIIGAGAVVTKSVPPYSIVGGVPANIIKYRFKKEQIEKLEHVKWWEWELDKIEENKDYFTNELIDEFLLLHFKNN